MKWLTYDSPVMQVITRITNYILVNLLCFLCMLPLITAGAAISAKYYVGMKLVKGEDPSIIKTFFGAFVRNLKQTILPGILTVVAGGILLWDWRYALSYDSSPVYRWSLILVSLFYMMIVFSFFAVISRYEIKNGEAFKAAVGMTFKHFGRLLLAVIMVILPLIISIWYLKWAWVICLFAQCVMLHYNSLFFVKEFKKLEEKMGL